MKKKIPLLKDHHTHIFLWTVLENDNVIDLSSITDINYIKSCAHQNKKEDIIVCKNWDDSKLVLCENDLDVINHPVIVFNKSLHFFIINGPGRNSLSLRGFEKLLQNRDDKMWLEKNVHLMLKLIMLLKSITKEDLIHFYNSFLLKRGVYYAEEMTVLDESEISLFHQAGLSQRTRFWADIDTFRKLSETGKKAVAGIKIFTDGALGTRTACVSEPYDGIGGKHGVQVYEDSALYEMIKEVDHYHKSLSIHAIGDLAIEQTVRILDQYKSKNGSIPGTRMEHCLFIDEKSARKAKQLNIQLCMQPGFSWDSGPEGYYDRLSANFLSQANPFRMLIDETGFIPGKNLILGSDGMLHDAFFQLSYALFPKYLKQALTLDEFTAGYCLPEKTMETTGYLNIHIDPDKQKVAVDSVMLTNSGQDSCLTRDAP